MKRKDDGTGRSGELTEAEKQRMNQWVAAGKAAYSVKEAAAELGVSTWFVRAEIKRGWLQCSQVSGRVLIPGWELIRYLISGTRVGPTTP